MASGSNMPSFDEILKRGSATEPKHARPVPKVRRLSHDNDLSLNSAVKAAKESKKRQGIPRASSASEPSKRKSNKNKVGDDESGFSSDGSPNQSRRRTPMTMPRTKVTAATPLEQKIALKRLKQRLSFDDHDNKENKIFNGGISETCSRYNGTALPDDGGGSVTSSNMTSDNQPTELSDVDTSKVNERLVQVREYIKQATGMYLSLSMAETDEPKRTEQMAKLAKLIQQLRIQEQGYNDLLRKTMQDQEDTEKQSVTSTERSFLPTGETDQQNFGGDVVQQQQELERLKEQQLLLKKIVTQQKELQQLKDRQSTLLKMQENAENLITEHRNVDDLKTEIDKNNLSTSQQQRQQQQQQQQQLPKDFPTFSEDDHSTNTATDSEDTEKIDSSTLDHRVQLEDKLKALHEKKQQMDDLMNTLKNLKKAQQVEANMRSVLNDDDLSEVASEVLAAAEVEDDGASSATDIEHKIDRLNDVRERLQELRSIVTEYETSSKNILSTTDASKDNRLQAKQMKQKQANTLTGFGGARLRVPASGANNQDVILKDLQALQASIEELMDNRNRPIPQGIPKKNIDVTRNAPFKNKNTNQEKKQNPSVPDEYAEKLRELNHARQQFTSNIKKDLHSSKPNNTDLSGTENMASESSVKDSDLESTASSTLQWQDDPEFQNKVKKLHLAKEKLHHLQELVRVVQQGGGPHLPIGDLEDLTLTLSDDQVESEYGESEEEAYDEANEGSDEEEEEEEEDEDDEDDDDEDENNEEENNEEEETEADGQSDVSKSTDVNYDLGSKNGLSDNERRYQGLLRKQRLELNYLLKERERLLQAQRKLSDLAGQPPLEEENESEYRTQKKSRASAKQKPFPSLTKAELRKQEKQKQNKAQKPMRQLFPGGEEQFYGSEPLSNPMAVSEIRRQRDLFEERKKQKFVEKQRRKKQSQNDENQSDDRATYVINSDIDEGVGVSMYSADVTTAATWGGSTEQSSDDEDSAVGDEYPDRENIANDDDEYGSHFDQAEEEEEEDGGSNAPPLFKVKKFEEQPRRSIKWNQNMPEKKERGIGSVSWSLDVSPPRSRKRTKQGNLTPAHKLIEDNRRKRRHKVVHKERPPVNEVSDGQVHSQLATICSSLLRNEQTLLQMLQNQMVRNSETTTAPPVSTAQNMNVVADIQDFFTSSNHSKSFTQTLSALRAAYERVEQHQLDMEYLRQQFERLNQQMPQIPAQVETSDIRSPWLNQPPSLHFSSFGPVTAANASQAFGTPSASQSQDRQPLYQKETQTETTLFEDPFRPSIQQYTLFGEPKEDGEDDRQPRNFDFSQMEPTSPGVVGDRIFANQRHGKMDEEATEENVMFPYRLTVSEYNPSSYQGNFANTMTGNVMTVSKMSMSKKRAETNSCETGEKSIWPSFFKLTDNADEQGDKDPSEKSANLESSVAGQSSSNEQKGEMNKSEQNAASASGDDSNFSLFEALRDSIYSEVATLIAMNESRPHYLIELFRELQLLNSDYLRQRALYSLQELVTRYLTDENVSPSKAAAFTKETLPASGISYEQWIASASEQTPSESVMTTDDESESQALQTLTKQIQNNEMYDYAELAESQSEGNLSTPGSHLDTPFAAEDLGNTVINLEDALHKMRTYEANMAEAKRAFEQISNNVRESTPSNAANSQQVAYETIKRRLNANLDSISNSSAGDMNSEASSDMPQPSVDTQKLDRQIKAVMMDLIPFLNENIDQTCTEEFLDNIRNLIVEFAKQKEPGSEEEQFGRFFHSQLDSILRDSLMKFNARKLKECGEDILIDVSEILFNELAFFKLMQDLDRPLCGAASAEYSSQHHGNDHSKMPFANQSTIYDDSSAAESVDAPNNEEIPVTTSSNSNSSVSTSSSNAFVMIDPMQEISDDETESSRHQFVKVELSVSETRPVRSSGSGEEDNEEEPPTFSTVSTPASSIHTYSQSVQSAMNNEQGAGSSGLQQPLVEEQDNDQSLVAEDDRDEGDRDAQEDERSEHEREVVVIDVASNVDDGEEEEDVENDGNAESERAEGQREIDEVAESESNMALGESDQQNNQAESSLQQQDTEEGAEDDLPEADMASEDNIVIAQVVLAHLEGERELAGDPNALPAPNGNYPDQ